MLKAIQAAMPVAKENAKVHDVAKAAEGMWAALLSGSACGKVEQAATQKLPAH